MATQASTTEKRKRRWLSFSVRGMLILLLLTAIASWWYLVPAAVEYHETVIESNDRLSHFGDLIFQSYQKQYVAKSNHPKKNTRAGTNSVDINVSTVPSTLVVYDFQGKSDTGAIYLEGVKKGSIQFRAEARYLTYPFFKQRIEETISAIDRDQDGFFDEEEHRYYPPSRMRHDWSRKIHIPVPKIEP